MISISNTRLSIPQGETGSVTFYFKDYKTDNPLILSGLSDKKHQIILRIRTGADNASEIIIEDKFLLNDFNGDEVDTNESLSIGGETYYRTARDFHIFDSNIIEDYPSEPTNVKQNVLYKKYEGDAKYYVYKYNDTSWAFYDYDNSSLTVNFDRTDTINLRPKTYYYEIGFVVYDENDNIVHKETWVEPTEFIVLGGEI